MGELPFTFGNDMDFAEIDSEGNVRRMNEYENWIMHEAEIQRLDGIISGYTELREQAVVARRRLMWGKYLHDMKGMEATTPKLSSVWVENFSPSLRSRIQKTLSQKDKYSQYQGPYRINLGQHSQQYKNEDAVCLFGPYVKDRRHGQKNLVSLRCFRNDEDFGKNKDFLTIEKIRLSAIRGPSNDPRWAKKARVDGGEVMNVDQMSPATGRIDTIHLELVKSPGSHFVFTRVGRGWKSAARYGEKVVQLEFQDAKNNWLPWQ